MKLVIERDTRQPVIPAGGGRVSLVAQNTCIRGIIKFDSGSNDQIAVMLTCQLC